MATLVFIVEKVGTAREYDSVPIILLGYLAQLRLQTATSQRIAARYRVQKSKYLVYLRGYKSDHVDVQRQTRLYVQGTRM